MMGGQDQETALSEQADGPQFEMPPRERFANPTAREKLYGFLRERPAGADAQELVSLLFQGAGSDPGLGPRLIRSLLGGDPNFSFDEATQLWSLREMLPLRVPLAEAPFVVVDLETTGGRVAPDSIIEIGAYRMRGQRMEASFQSLVRPRGPLPRFITRLTSITNEMVATAPPIEDVLPAFREFLGGAVMVAHNAPYDHSYLDFEFRRLFGIGIQNPVLCTIRMARKLLPSLKRRRLDLLAEHFGLSTAGRHRALGDARMTAELLSIMLEMMEKIGLSRLDRVIDYQGRGVTGRRIERHVPPEVINVLPSSPGLYLMRNQRGGLLYIGKATRLKERVASYFNGSVSRKTAELVSHTWAIETRLLGSPLEAALEEARLIRELKPPFNRQLKSMPQLYLLQIDLNEQFPRMRVVRKARTVRGLIQAGPFVGRRSLDHAARVISRLLGLRLCSERLAPDEEFSACLYGQIGQCAAPCNESVTANEYRAQAIRAARLLEGRGGDLLQELMRAREQAGAALRFEEARRHHRDLITLTALCERAARVRRLMAERAARVAVSAEPLVLTGPAAPAAASALCTTAPRLES